MELLTENGCSKNYKKNREIGRIGNHSKIKDVCGGLDKLDESSDRPDISRLKKTGFCRIYSCGCCVMCELESDR